MLSVTQRLQNVSQPNNGYVPKSLFVEHQYEDYSFVEEIESAFSPIQGLAVDYLTRYMISGDKHTAFNISILGAKEIDEVFENNNEYSNICKLLDKVNGLDNDSIYYTCQIVGYDIAYRKSVESYQDVNNINASKHLINNVRIMVTRCLYFLTDIGPVVSDGFAFEGGYTQLVSSGDGDYLTNDLLIDIKVSKNSFSTKWSLQLLMYYLLGFHSIHSEFKSIKKLCIYNPLENKSYIVKLSDISDESKYKVSHDVLGYKMHCCLPHFDFKTKKFTIDFSSWKQIDGSDSDVMKQILTDNMDTSFSIQNYNNGIHDISIDDYWTYLRTISDEYKYKLRPVFKNTDHIIMIKNNGFVLFMSVSNKGNLNILNGGRKKKATFTTEYYFENLEKYAMAVISRFSKYWDALYKISEQIVTLTPDKEILRKNQYAEYVRDSKSLNTKPLSFNDWYKYESKDIKLSGRVHGCIVDIDYFNHIYLNPYDGTVVPYMAFSMYDKNVYKNTLSLISTQRPEMLPAFKELISVQSTSLSAANKNVIYELVSTEDEVSTEFVKVYSHDMYGISNRLKPLQNIYDKKLIQVWEDEILGDTPALPKKRDINLLSMANTTNTTNTINTTNIINMTNMMKCGMSAKVIEDNGCKDITVEFEDGLIRRHMRRDKFKCGTIAHKVED